MALKKTRMDLERTRFDDDGRPAGGRLLFRVAALQNRLRPDVGSVLTEDEVRNVVKQAGMDRAETLTVNVRREKK